MSKSIRETKLDSYHYLAILMHFCPLFGVLINRMNGQIKLKNGKSVVLMKYHAQKCMWHKKQSVNPSNFRTRTSNNLPSVFIEIFRYASESIQAACDWAYKGVSEGSTLAGTFLTTLGSVVL